MNYAFEISNWTSKIAAQVIQAKIQVHNLEVLEPDMAVIFVVNRFTRTESLLLPYILQKQTQLPITSLASEELFQGHIGQFVRSTSTVNLQTPHHDKNVIHSLLLGKQNWLIFPQGCLLRGHLKTNQNASKNKQKKINGAAILALRSELYRYQLNLKNKEIDKKSLQRLLKHFHLEKITGIQNKRTVIVPITITYAPIRPQQDALLSFSRSFLNKKLEFSVENTIFSKDSNIDISLAEPIDVQTFVKTPLSGKRFPFKALANKISRHYTTSIYKNISISFDHILTGILFCQAIHFTESSYRLRTFHCIHTLSKDPQFHLRASLKEGYFHLIDDEKCLPFEQFFHHCQTENIILPSDEPESEFSKNQEIKSDFCIILNEAIEHELMSFPALYTQIKKSAQMPELQLKQFVVDSISGYDKTLFLEDYKTFYQLESKPENVGTPFLLHPKSPRAGIVLVHGYMAAPLEVRAMAEYLCKKNFAVYVVRLKGHGTSPEDLAQTSWEEWYESVNRGYVIIKHLCPDVILGGFSTGGVMALIAAAKKNKGTQAIFAINTPVQFRSYVSHLIPTMITLNTLFEKAKASHKGQWEFVANEPENPHINYFQNPLYGLQQLGRAIDVMKQNLPAINAPTFILQSSGDPVVDESSARSIYDTIASQHKELCLFSSDRHGVVNGEYSERLFDLVDRFLLFHLTESNPSDKHSKRDYL